MSETPTSRGRPFVKGLRRGSWLLGALFAISVASIGLFVVLISNNHSRRWDMSVDGHNTLHPSSVQVLRRLEKEGDEPLQIAVLFSPGSLADRNEQKLIGRLANRVGQVISLIQPRCERLRVRVLDPFTDTAAVAELQRRFAPTDLNNCVVVYAGEGQERRRVIKRHQLADLNVVSRQITRYKVETALIQALDVVATARNARLVARVMQGGGELDLDRELRSLSRILGPEGVAVEPLLSGAEIPPDTALLILAGTEVLQKADALAGYLAGGGRVLVTPRVSQMDLSLERVLARYGVGLTRRVVLQAGAEPFKLTLRMRDQRQRRRAHPVVRELRADRAIIFPGRRWRTLAIEPATELPEGLAVQPLLTVDKAMTLDADQLAELARRGEGANIEPPTESGPQHVAALSSWPAGTDGRRGKLAVIGYEGALSDSFLGTTGTANHGLVYNTLQWLLDREELLVDRPSERRGSRLPMLLEDDAKRWLHLQVVMVPMLALFCGIIIWLIRKE